MAVERCFTIVNKLGLHARAAAKLVQAANRFKSEIALEKDGQTVNGKSIMGVLMLAAARRAGVPAGGGGADAAEALAAIAALIEDGFGEDK